MKKRKYTENDAIIAAQNSKSIAGFLRLLGLKPVGGNYYTAKSYIQKHKLNTDHWTGQGWNKNKQLKKWTDYKRPKNFKKHLIKQKGHCCENCKNTHWNQLEIPLEVHHNDGDRTNNSLENLVLLCCNCHAQTKNWRGRKNTQTNNNQQVTNGGDGRTRTDTGG